MRAFLRNNSLCVVMFGLSVVFILGLSLVRAREQASDEREHGRPAGGYVEYVTSGDFVEAVSFALHAWGGAYSEEQQEHGGATVSTPAYVTTARFWEEAFQNWQSEFFSIGVLLILSIWLRERGLPESKRVLAAHSAMGT